MGRWVSTAWEFQLGKGYQKKCGRNSTSLTDKRAVIPWLLVELGYVVSRGLGPRDCSTHLHCGEPVLCVSFINTVRSCAVASPTASATRAGGILPCGSLPPLLQGSSSSKVLDSFRLAPSRLVSLVAGYVPLLRPAELVLCRVCRERKTDESRAYIKKRQKQEERCAVLGLMSRPSSS